MIKAIKAALFFFIGLFLAGSLHAQIVKDNSVWTFEAKKKSGSDYQLIAHLQLPEHWHIYAFKPGGDGSLFPPSIKFTANANVKLKGAVKEQGKLVSENMDGIDGTVNMYLHKVDYIQDATITGNTKISGTYNYQICDEKMCLPPTKKSFTIEVKDAGEAQATTTEATTQAPTDSPVVAATTAPADTTKTVAAAPVASTKDDVPAKNDNKGAQQSLLMLFLISLGGGILAVFTPCIFSMIPITVSFFTKRSKTRAEGIRNAIYYSTSIIVIFTVLGVLISAIFGSAALNTLSTDWRANLFFFILIVIFAISFLGAFEISLPSSWTNATDSRAGVGSFAGIFFMALTLVIVSFSCTGPIVGTLLVEASKGGVAGPAIGMFGFSIGLSLPFALFAVFPGWLNKMASSGGWLNQVKVTLGLVELMLALKFLSNADLAMGWRLLDREIFIAIWIVLAVILGFYLLGKLKLSHDDESPKNVFGQEYVSIFKLFLAITSFVFAVYLLPGMWGAPLNGMSAFLPPMGTFDAFGSGGGSGNAADDERSDNGLQPVKYVADMKLYEPQVVKTLGLTTYFDYDEALAASKKLKKPIMLDFTGINCVNCRKMESQVWSKPEVAKMLKEDFIVVSLYCDFNRLELPKDQQYFSKVLNQQVETVGNKNADLQATKFGSNSQPFYFYVDEQGNKLVDGGYSYDPDIQKFVAHLEKVKANFKASHP